jgi:hypothetical protein
VDSRRSKRAASGALRRTQRARRQKLQALVSAGSMRHETHDTLLAAV